MKATREYSKIQEKFVAKAMEGKVVSNSGATPFNKGDVEPHYSFDMLVECKTKTKQQTSHSIKREWLEEIKKEALQVGHSKGAVVFDFGEEKKTLDNQYIVMSLRDYIGYKRC